MFKSKSCPSFRFADGKYDVATAAQRNVLDFQLNDEQLHLKKSVREFAEREILPHVMEWDEAGEFPLATIKELGKLGLLGTIFPAEYGGPGMGYVEYVTTIEELSRVDGSVGIIVAAHTSLCSNHIYLAGTEEQKKKYVTKLATGEYIGAWGLTEPSSGSDAGSARMTAVRKGNDWVLNGTKTFITNGRYADVLVVIAVTDRTANTHGLSAFIVEKDAKGFRPGKKENKLGLRASDTSELIFEDCVIPAGNLLGKEGAGFIDAMRVLDGGRISIAALALGMAEGAYECALKYSKQRKQFGKAISEFQGIQWKLADMATEIEAAKLLTFRAASMKDAGMKSTQESSMAKLFTSEVAVRCANESVQIHGGYGFIKDYPAEKFYRDVKLCTIGEGTSEVQRLVIARQLLKD
ncbi:MAG TPA: acyl-CoA dehydrogenase [Terriglobales bacterium]|jgi:alkylation response protein AidB-like acyl-CoA dehydrogenase|nr:acyl-CoA dehydrogenase [Terriglobales bacterium]